MDVIATLEADRREKTGSNQAHTLRKEGQMPAVLYGQDDPTISLSVDQQEFNRAFENNKPLFELELDGETETAKLKDLQWDHLGEKILHVDFQRVSFDEPIELHVPVVTVGTSSILEGRGAYLQKHIDTLRVKTLPENLPPEIPIPIDGLEIGDTIHVSDVVFPDEVETTESPHTLIFSVHEAEEVVVEEEEMDLAPTAMEPELVGEEEEEEALEGELEEGEEPEGEEVPEGEPEA